MFTLSSARSEKDRISFFSKNIGITAMRDEKGDIIFMKSEEDLKGIVFFIIFAIICTSIKRCIIIPLIEKEILNTNWYMISLVIYFIFTIISVIVIRSEGEELRKNHGAEHMVCSAYRKLKKVPSLKETKRFSRISKSCGVSLYSAAITAEIIGFIVFKYIGYQIPEIILLSIPIFLKKFFPFNLIGKFIQLFTTAKPDNSNIILALSALNELLEIEEKQ